MAYANENAVPIRDDIYWIGGDDRTASIFEGAFPIPEGVSYNSYLIKDEKTCLLDSCDASIAAKYWRNLRTALDRSRRATRSPPAGTPCASCSP